jgi:acyl transferase domain-containing protein
MENASQAALSAIKLALLAKRQRDAGHAGAIASEPIAIIGMACRFPDGADSPAAFWQLLRDGRDAVIEIPEERWRLDEWFSPDASASGKTSTPYAAILRDVDLFDPVFFGISPREALQMDPQQRLLLEVVWEALADAGQPVDELSASRTSVFMAVFNSDYAKMQCEDAMRITQHTMAGGARSIAAGRIAFLLDLHGPCVSVDTACSSSLVAIHLACQSLRHGESTMAIVGGASLRLKPQEVVALSKLGMLAPDGRCKAFDASANGFGFGEGCGVVILKRLADALQQNDPIWAVIRGTAINQDGRSNVLTAPNGLAQQALIRDALRNAQVSGAQISLVEAHGTGTSLGDPIEVESLAETLGGIGSNAPPCALTSVKTNIGHLEAAAGIAGLIRAVLCLRHEAIPPHLHFQRLNPQISLAGSRFFIPTRLHPWPRTRTPRLAGVSSFGFSGTNAHVVLEEAPAIPNALTGAVTERPTELIAISARTSEALRELARRYSSLLADSAGPVRLSDVAYTANVRRSHYEHRAAVVASSCREAHEAFTALAGGRDHPAAMPSASQSTTSRPIAFVFSGQGAQWPRMGLELFEAEPEFQAAIQECDGLIRELTGWSLIEILRAETSQSRLDETEFAQPAIFAVQVALVRLWKSWGITPAAVVGHSAGEVAAACVAGVLSLKEAIRVIVQRGHIMQEATGRGRMAGVSLPAVDAERLVRPWSDRICVAASNGPASCVISGDVESISAVLAKLAQEGIAVRELPVQYAFHSPQMDASRAALIAELGAIQTEVPSTPLYSTVTGSLAGPGDFDAAYWGRNVREPVRFDSAIAEMTEAGFDTFIEVAPHAVLTSSIVECCNASQANAVVIPSMRRSGEQRKTILKGLAKLYVQGHTISWRGLHYQGGRCVSLPSYPWQRKRYWLSPSRDASSRAVAGTAFQLRPVRSPLLPAQVFETELDAALPFIADHRIHGALIVPMAAIIALISQAVTSENCDSSAAIEDLMLHEPMRIDTDGKLTVQVTRSGGELGVHSWTEERWVQHASGKAGDRIEAFRMPEPPVQAEPVSPEDHYAELQCRGIKFGPTMRVIDSIAVAERYARLSVKLAPDVDAAFAGVLQQPILLDAAFHGLSHLLLAASDGVYLPIAVDVVQLFAPLPLEFTVHAYLHEAPSGTSETRSGDLFIVDSSGVPIAALLGFRFKKASAAALESALERQAAEGMRYEQRWEPAPLRAAVSPDCRRHWLILADDTGMADLVVGALEQAGHSCSCVRAQEELSLLTTDACDAVLYFWSLDVPALPADTEFRPAHGRLFGSITKLLKALTTREQRRPTPVYLITRGAVAATSDRDVTHAASAMLWGMGRTLGLEHPELECTLIDLDPGAEIGRSARQLADELMAGSPEQEIAYREGARMVRRLVRQERSVFETGHWQLRIHEQGRIENLAVEPAPRITPAPDEICIRVHAAGLNFRDVLLALGMYPGDDAVPLGAECAGVVESIGKGVTTYQVGDQVMALSADAFAQFVNVPVSRVSRVPHGLTLAQAATLPVAYLTAVYALDRTARLRSGDKVLIHAAAGGVGLAAVQIAQSAGAEVFATVGSSEKAEYLRSLGVKYIANSRTLDFRQRIREWTEAGVDVVLNSLSGESIPASLACLAPAGRFIEIGKRGIWTPEQVASARPDVMYQVLDLNRGADGSPGLIESLFCDLVRAIESCKWQPLPHTEFPMGHAADAFRYMAQAKHIGKVVLRAPQHRLQVKADASYLITGGLGALGLHVARFLIERGARWLALIGRRGPDAGLSAGLRELELLGAQVKTFQADIAEADSLRAALESIELTMPPLAGVVHAAGVIDDGLLLNQTSERFLRVCDPKVQGTWNLHEATAKRPLDFFILFSSVAAVLGSPGQSNYAAANAFLDAMGSVRRNAGLPALVVHWGTWAGAGMAGRVQNNRARLGLRGLRPMTPPECLDALERSIETMAVQTIVTRCDWEAIGSQLGARAPLVSKLRVSRSVVPTQSAAPRIRSELEAAPASQKSRLLIEYLRRQVLRVLDLPPDFDLGPQRPLIAFGLDSLMAVELGNVLSAELDLGLAATVVFDHPTLDLLAEYLLQRVLRLQTAQTPTAADAQESDRFFEDVRCLSEKEAEALLAAELQQGESL